MVLRVAERRTATDTGRQREANEDSLFARAPLFAVADGMGGAQAGEVASRIAVEAFEAGRPRARELARGAACADRRAGQPSASSSLAQGDSSRSGMGTTLTAALVDGDEVSFGHVGDSRAYVFRDGELKQLTNDHSLVEELRRQGKLTREQAAEHPQRSVITRALGPEPQVEVDTMTFRARPGDVFLLCSDGLTTMLNDDGSADDPAPRRTTSTAAARARQGRQRARRPRQHHRRPLPARGRRRERAADDGADAGRPERRGGGADSAERRPRRRAERRERAPRARGRRATPAAGRDRRQGARGRCWSSRRSPSAPTSAPARSGSSAPTRAAGSRLYRGLPYDLPFGIELYSEDDSIPVRPSRVPEDRREVAHRPRAALARRRGQSLLDDLEADAVTPTAPQATAGLRRAAERRAAAQAGRRRRRRGSDARRRRPGAAAATQGGAGGERQLSARNRELLGARPGGRSARPPASPPSSSSAATRSTTSA